MTDESSEHCDSSVIQAEPVDGEKPNCAGQFVHSFGHSLIQGPIDGVTEVVNKFTGNMLPKIQVIKPPEKKEIGTPEWEAQKVGSGAGLIAMLFVVGALLSRRR